MNGKLAQDRFNDMVKNAELEEFWTREYPFDETKYYSREEVEENIENFIRNAW